MKLTPCLIQGHYYKMVAINTELQDKIPEDKYYVKCQRCGNTILIHDKCYYQRKDGTYKL